MNKKHTYWKGKKVLVTGYEGFVGSNLTRALKKAGAKVTGLDVKVKRKNTLLTGDDYKNITVVKGSVSNYKLLGEIISKRKIEVVFHLAAEAIVGRSQGNPLGTFSSNIRGTWNVLESCRLASTVETVVVASSDKAYGSHKKLPYRENASLKGSHPYDVSKSCADLIAHTYFRTYNLPVAVTRCANIYGAGDFNFSRIIPDAVRCALSGKELVIRSDGKFVRDYVYIEDVVAAYMKLVEKMRRLKLYGEAFNFSNERPISVIELVKNIYRLAGKTAKYKILNEAKYEIKRQYLASEKAGNILNWKPKYTLEQGLKKTINWYKEYLENNSESYLKG